MNKQKATEIKAVLQNMNRETVEDALSLLLSENAVGTQSSQPAARGDFINFAQAIMYLKKHFKFAELDLFTTEADLVYVNTGDRKVLLTDRDSVSNRNANVGVNTNIGAKQPALVDLNNILAEDKRFEEAFENNRDDSSRFSYLEL